MEATASPYNLLPETTSHHFHCFLFIRSKSVRAAHTEGGGTIQGRGSLGSLGLSWRVPTPVLIEVKNIFGRTCETFNIGCLQRGGLSNGGGELFTEYAPVPFEFCTM